MGRPPSLQEGSIPKTGSARAGCAAPFKRSPQNMLHAINREMIFASEDVAMRYRDFIAKQKKTTELPEVVPLQNTGEDGVTRTVYALKWQEKK